MRLAADNLRQASWLAFLLASSLACATSQEPTARHSRPLERPDADIPRDPAADNAANKDRRADPVDPAGLALSREQGLASEGRSEAQSRVAGRPDSRRPSTEDPHPSTFSVSPFVLEGELPWWHDLEPGAFRFQGRVVVLARGESLAGDHLSQGLLRAKTSAMLRAKKKSQSIPFKGRVPEPRLVDLFLTRSSLLFALYELPILDAAPLTGPLPQIGPPTALQFTGPRRIGRHRFEGAQHLFLECEVEGPISNPDWWGSRAYANNQEP